MELVVFLVAIVFFTWLKGRLSVENPGGTQQCMEALLTNSMGVGARDLLEDIAGHGGEKYLPMIGSIGMFVLMSNMISVVPGFSSPTAENSVPLGCADCRVSLLQLVRHRASRTLWIRQAFPGSFVPAMSPIMLLDRNC